MAFDSLKTKDCIKYVWGSDKSNEMLEKMKIEIALVYNWSVHDQYSIRHSLNFIRNDKVICFLWFFKAG